MAGTGRRPYGTVEVTGFAGASRRLAPPDSLGDLQKQAFLNLVASCPASQFKRGDVDLLCRWSELTVMCEQAAFELQQNGMVTAKAKVSPWFAIYRDATRELRMLSQRLHLGPRSRTLKAARTQTGPMSYYDEMRLRGDLDDVDTH
jgi:phage terminase small subunit